MATEIINSFEGNVALCEGINWRKCDNKGHQKEKCILLEQFLVCAYKIHIMLYSESLKIRICRKENSRKIEDVGEKSVIVRSW